MQLYDTQLISKQQNITDYPLISKSKSSHAFRATLVDFFDQVIEAAHESEVMYMEASLVDNLNVWIASMSSAHSRPFRHTSTLVGLTIASAMCRVANTQTEATAKVLRQVEGEKKKKGTNKNRLVDFQRTAANNEKKQTYLENQIMDLFNTIYVHRYRDIDPRIRIECVDALGYWILTLPSQFFEGQFLRYMGWMLSDTHGPMRHEVIKQLLKIMKNPENAGGMRHFIERFRPRMVEMATRDSEPGVRASAVELMDMIRQAGMLEPDDIDVIGKLIFDTDAKVRKSLVGFFSESIKDLYEAKVEELGGEEALEDILTVEDEEDFDTPRAEWIRFKCVAEILMSYDSQDQEEMPSQIDAADFLNLCGSESRFTLATQVLYEKISDLKNWEALAGYLLFDHTSRATGNETERVLKESFKPDEKEELILLEILNAIVKLNVTQGEDADKIKDKSKKKQAKAEASESKETMARHLAGLIPRLLKKYGANPKTATVVLRLEHVLNLGVFQELRQDSTVYAKLLDEISAQFNGHADKGVLSEAGAAFLHARGYEELEEVTESKVQSLWEDTTNTLRKINKVGDLSVRGALRNKVLTQLSHNLARLEQLASISSCVEPLEAEGRKDDTQPIIILLDIIARGVFESTNDDALDALEDEVVVSAIRSAMFYFMWKTRALMESVSSGEEIADVEIDNLKERQEAFMTNTTAAFSSRSTLDTVRLLGAGTVLDAHVLFTSLRPAKPKGKQTASDNDDQYAYLQTLISEIAPEVQTELASIFDGLEKQFAKKAKKKLAEPGEDEEPEDLDSEPEDEDDYEVTDSERHAETLNAEKQLCELTGKLVLAILAQVIDASGSLKGKFQSRLQRNRQVLGPSFKEIVAYLDDPKAKAKKSHKSKAQQAAAAAKKAAKSTKLVEEEEEEEEPFADDEPEEGTAEDLRRRELLDEPPESVDEEADAAGDNEEEDEIMGD